MSVNIIAWTIPGGVAKIVATANQTTAESTSATVSLSPGANKRWVVLAAQFVMSTEVDTADVARIYYETADGKILLGNTNTARLETDTNSKLVWPADTGSAKVLGFTPLILQGANDKITFKIVTTATLGNRIWKGLVHVLEVPI